MALRETKTQLAAVALAMALATLWLGFGLANPIASGLLVVTFYVLVFAGAHAYLALRGDGDSVPVDARWRFVGLVVFGVLAVTLGNAFARVEVAGQSLGTVAWAAVLAVFAGYWYYESRDAYRQTRPS
ncbi:hypothetical protein [Haloarcula onubensis]|uniref:Uncharacterized protein n=1 Tax=Haloarcula onubensis TaxID=2950539 RepID=A0ABU2FKV9_9EURY|nr:hypothetical protein [Halomicroarcula sp. S3CR25-11]MDS0281382.1 hypothetical protein [Halomicroarcula sp. S3CR25-11]